MLFLWILLAIIVLVLFIYFYLIVKRLILLKKIGKWVKKRNGSMQYCRNPLISVFRHDGKTDISLQFREKTIDISIITTPLRKVRYHFDIDDKLLYLIIERKAIYVGGTRAPKPTYISDVDWAFTIRKYRMEFRANNDHQKYVILNPAPISISKVTGATSSALYNNDELIPGVRVCGLKWIIENILSL